MFYFKSFLWDITMHFWLFPISMALQISIIRKGKGLDLDQFWSKPNESVWHRWKIAQQFRGKCFCFLFVKKKNVVLIDEKHEGGDCESWNFAQGPIRPSSSKDYKTIFCQSLPSSWCKYLSIFFTHESQRTMWHSTRPTYLQQKLPLACYNFFWLLSRYCLYSTRPQIYVSKVKIISKYLFLWNNRFLGKWGRMSKIL